MKTIILLHGALGASDQLESLAGNLKNIKLYDKVFTYNFSGHSKKPFAENFGIRQFADEVSDFIKENSLNKPDLFGYSMGGFVALTLGRQNANVIGNIVTLGTKFEWTPEIAQKEIKMLDPRVILEKVPRFAESLKERHGDDWELLLQKTSQMMVDLGNKNTLTSADYSSIKNKVLIGIADKDNMVSLEETVSVCKQLPDSSMFMLPNAKHPIETVNVKLLSEIISSLH